MHNNLQFVRRFMIWASIVVALVVAGTFIGFHLRTEKLTIGLVHQQAEALFRQVVLTRRWVTKHGGVFVRVQPGVNPNPYLTSIPGMKVTISDQDGVLYTLRNPGLVTREISQLATESGLFTVRITSLKPVNVATNTPDDFERRALHRLEEGEQQVSEVQQTLRGPVYRFIGPLYYEDSCNSCHSTQGYRRGDIRGGISISIPMAAVSNEIALNRLYTIASGLLVFILLFSLLAVLSRRFIRELGATQDELLRLASTDSLTGLLNRKTALARFEEEVSRHERSGSHLSCLLMDLDSFKEINDTYGHQAGDRVIEAVSRRLTATMRKHDILCRYGGEEFLAILPDTRLQAAVMVAEKLRSALAEEALQVGDSIIHVRVSCGVAERQAGEGVDLIISRADGALYRAKSEGRDRVCSAGSSLPADDGVS